MKAIVTIIVVILLSIIAGADVYAQQTIILKDKYTLLPVENAGYYCGDQKGISGKNGVIVFTTGNTNRLIITHIAYETLELGPAEIAAAVQRGWIELHPSRIDYLNPVTVYALKGKAIQQTVKLGNADWVQHDAGQVLQQVPGFSAVRKSGAFGFDPVFRGWRGSQLNIVSDGALTSVAACPNRMDPPTSQVLISQVQQIEILKGPHSFRYGPAMGAVINFISAPPAFSTAPKAFGRITTGYESNGAIYRAEGNAGISNQRMQLAVTGSWSKGQHYKDGNDSTVPAGFNRGAIALTAHVQVKPGHLLKLSAARNYARKTDFPTLMMDLVSDDTWMLQGAYTITGNHAWYSQWHTQAYTSLVDHCMNNGQRPAYASMQAATSATTAATGARTEWTIEKNTSKIIWGADLKYETADGNRERKMMTGPMAGKTFVDTLWQNSSMARGGLFGEWHYQWRKYKLSISGRLDAVQAKARDVAAKFRAQYADVKRTDFNVSMSAGIARQWQNRWQAGIWLGRGVRSASITEKYINSLPVGIDPYEMLGYPQLHPEANNQADIMIGYRYEGTAVQWNGFASLVTDYISSEINANIAPAYGAPGVRQYVNIKEAILYGFELSWLQQWGPALQQQCTVACTYGKNNSTGQALPEIAPMDLRYRLEAGLLKNKIMPYAQWRYVCKQERIADDFGEMATPAFTTVDCGVKVVWIKKLPVTFAINNLFDKAWHEHLSRYIRPALPLNAPGRSFIIMASYDF